MEKIVIYLKELRRLHNELSAQGKVDPSTLTPTEHIEYNFSMIENLINSGKVMMQLGDFDEALTPLEFAKDQINITINTVKRAIKIESDINKSVEDLKNNLNK